MPHFRTAALRSVGGWDAWNVTEDADLGLRLARFGYRIDILDSATGEEAPETLSVWFKQRRRWKKGWMQTLLVLARDPRVAARDFGPWHAGVVALMLLNLVVGPLFLPLFLGLVIVNFAETGMPTPHGAIEIMEATLSFSVLGLGVASTLWCGYAGLRIKGRGASLASLPWLLPYQLLISAAAWGGLVDLVRNPYHWRKTAHGTAARRTPPSDSPADTVSRAVIRSQWLSARRAITAAARPAAGWRGAAAPRRS